VTTVGIGVDIVDVRRFDQLMARRPALEARLFTPAERRDAAERPERLAARFAAKEAVLKTLGVGLFVTSWHSIEIHRDEYGAPSVRLHGTAAELATSRGVGSMRVSMSHTDTMAAAFVVASAEPDQS
jgi:holo-[acyl-carrier protein] synthase